ncbi:MAG: hypothetical protein AAF533_26120 [Acidobacteriota bacterium]
MAVRDARKLPLLAFAVLVMVALHNIRWGRSDGGALLGWVPFELAYRMGWVALGALVLSWILNATWGRES